MSYAIGPSLREYYPLLHLYPGARDWLIQALWAGLIVTVFDCLPGPQLVLGVFEKRQGQRCGSGVLERNANGEGASEDTDAEGQPSSS